MRENYLKVSNQTTETIHNYLNENCKLFIHLTNELADDFHHDRHAFTIQLIEKGFSLRSKMLDLARQLFNLGFDLNWKVMYPTGQLIPLPNYPWDRKRYWIESSETSKGNELSEQYNDESNSLTKYYHSLAKDRKPLNEYLSFAPFMTIKPGFSGSKH